VVDGIQVTVGKLTNAERGIHEELIIHLLETQSQSQEGPKELNPTIGEKEAIPGVVCLEDGGAIPNLNCCLFH